MVAPTALPAAIAPFLQTTQNASPAPCVITAYRNAAFALAGWRVAAAAAGAPRSVTPAASRPPLTKTSRRVRISSSSAAAASRCSNSSMPCLLVEGRSTSLPGRRLCPLQLDAPPFPCGRQDRVAEDGRAVAVLEARLPGGNRPLLEHGS